MSNKKEKICLTCSHCGRVETRQGWGGDEWWHACKVDGAERRTIATCDKWESE